MISFSNVVPAFRCRPARTQSALGKGVWRSAILFAVIGMLLAVSSPAIAGPSDSDLVSLSSQTVSVGAVTPVSLQISLQTKTPAAAITIPLTYAGDPSIVLDQSFGVPGEPGITWDSLGALAVWTIKTVEVDTISKTILIGLVSFLGSLPASTGPLATIHLSANSPVAAGSVTVDTLTLPPANVLSLVDEAANEYFPQFTPGVITIEGGGGTDPEIALYPDSLHFAGIIGTPNPPPQYIGLANSGGGTLHWDAWAPSDQTWLTVSPLSGTGPGSLMVSVVTGALGGAGTWVGDITVRDLNATNSPQKVPVLFEVTKPTLDSSPSSVTFTAATGGPNPGSQDILLRASSNAVIAFSATTSVPWLTVYPTSGNTPVTVGISVDIAGMAPGSYDGYVNYTSASSLNSASTHVYLNITDGGNHSDSDMVAVGSVIAPLDVTTNVEVPITVNTHTPAAAMTIPLSYAGTPTIRLNHAIGDQGVVWDSVGQSTVWTIKSVLDDPANHTVLLGVISFAGSLPPTEGPLAKLNFLVDSTGTAGVNDIDTTFIPPANYLTIVDEAANEYLPQFTAGSVEVQTTGPVLDVPAALFNFNAIVDSTNPPPRTVHVFNNGLGTLHWTASADSAWIHLSKTSGTDNDSFLVAVDITGMPAGYYTGHVRVEDSAALGSPQYVEIKLNISMPYYPADSNYVAVSTAYAPLNMSSQVAVDVYMGSKDTLQAIAIPLTFAGNPAISVDTTVGVRGVVYGPVGADPRWAIRPVAVDPDSSRIVFAFISFSYVPPTQGHLATIYFNVAPTSTPDTTVIDTTFFPPANYITFATQHSEQITPAFDPGAIILQEFADSLCLSADSVLLQVERFSKTHVCSSVELSNCGGPNELDWYAFASCDYLEFPDSGNTGDECFGPCFNICQHDNTMPEGHYVCTLTVVSPTAVNSPQHIMVHTIITAPVPPDTLGSFMADLMVVDSTLITPDYVRFGAGPSFSDGYELEDIAKAPPPPGNYVRMFFYHPEWGQFTDQFQTDYRSPYRSGCKEWPLVVETDHRAPVMIQVPRYGLASNPYLAFMLLDMAGNVLSPDLEDHPYRYTAIGGRTAFVLRVCWSDEFTAHLIPGWNLASSPVAPFDPAWESILGMFPYFQVFEWNGAYFPSSEYPGCGDGYWIYAPDTATVQYAGSSCLPNPWDPFTRPLMAGWNLIGDPSPMVAPLYAMAFDSSGTILGYDNALARGWIAPGLWRWDPSGYHASPELYPGRGYWMPALVDGLDAIFVAGIDCVSTAMPVVPQVPEFTTVRLDGSQSLVQVGLAEDAHAGFDSRYDKPLPPDGPVPIARLALRSNLNPMFPDYAQDIRGEADEVSWRVVTRNAGADAAVVAEWLDKLTDQGYVLYLEDHEGAARVRLEEGVPQPISGTEFQLFAVRGNGSPGTRPERYFLAANFPNPFNPATQIDFGLAAAGHVDLTVYNVLGQQIRTLANGPYAAGTHSVTWDGKDNAGRAVASGLYFYRLRAGEFSATHKMLLMK